MAKATPQQQAVKDTIVLQAIKYILSDETANALASSAKSDPVEAIVNAVIIGLKGVKQAAEGAGRGYAGDKDFMLGAADEIVKYVSQLLGKMGVIPTEQAGQVGQQAMAQVQQIIGGQQGMLAQGA